MTKKEWDERRRQRVQRKLLGIKMQNLMADNAGKPARATNQVSFAELMKQLKGE